MEIQKRCNKCLEVKNLDCFYNQKHGSLGKTGCCITCRKKSSALWAIENRDRKNQKERERKRDRREYNKNFRLKNPEYFKNYRIKKAKAESNDAV